MVSSPANLHRKRIVFLLLLGNKHDATSLFVVGEALPKPHLPQLNVASYG